VPGVDDWLAIDIADEGHQAFLEFVFGGDADVAQDRARQLGSEYRRLATRILAYFMGNKVVRWTGRCGPMCATATSVVDSRYT
jgi:hypothetical protein